MIEEYTVPCPICNIERKIKGKQNYLRISRKKSVCRSCSNSINAGGKGVIFKNDTKICSYCHLYLPFSEFSKNSKNELKSRCKKCQKIYNQKYHEKIYRFDKYGISKEIFSKLFEKQEGKCVICDIKIDSKTCHIDHDHRTSKVRGLLCNLCNKGLGQFKDSIKNLEKAIKYLKNNE